MAILRLTAAFFAPPRMPPSARVLSMARRSFKPLRCSPAQQLQQEQEQEQEQGARSKLQLMERKPVKLKDGSAGILCEPCNGKGWLVCDFCKGQKTNVKSETNRIYRRCPSCRAIGYVLCSSCKVFKCVTFPNYNDGEELSF